MMWSEQNSDQDIVSALTPIWLNANRVCIGILAAHLVLAFVLAGYYSTWALTFAIAMPAFLMPLLLWRMMPLSQLTRISVGVSLQTFTALHIYQMHGFPEMHFFFFTAVTAMVVYQDLLAIIPGTAAIVAQHTIFSLLTNSGVNLYFFTEPRVSWLKLVFHFGIATAQVALAGWAISYMRSRTIENYKQKKTMTIREQSLTRIIEEVKMTAERLANSSERLRDSSLSLDTGARNQSDSVRKTAASVEEISASVQQTASNTSLATDLSASASRLAQDGNEVVLESVGAIGRLSNSFTEISSLVDGLDEIAFQTNILSINAAIEAANAGELGKSFAVVASEVRRLAMKSTSTARDAAKLIANSLENLHFSAEAVARSGTALSALVQNSQKVSATVSDISNAAKEESEGIRSIERAIEVLDSSSAEGSRQTSALLATAQDLDAAAQSLRTLVATADIKA